jgi:hypothetical protein
MDGPFPSFFGIKSFGDSQRFIKHQINIHRRNTNLYLYRKFQSIVINF